MQEALPETKFIFDILLSNEQKDLVLQFLQEVRIKREKYSTELLWAMDQEIGGIGGYCMPCDPKINPFPGGINRELFRPLQYARSEIDVCDVRIFARHAVHYSGMHLEAVLRLFLQETKHFGILRFYNSTLGKAVHEVTKAKIFNEVLTKAMFKFVTLYNMAKHEVNSIEDRPRLFSEADAVVSYFCARIIGQAVLKKLDFPLAFNKYEINNTAFNF